MAILQRRGMALFRLVLLSLLVLATLVLGQSIWKNARIEKMVQQDIVRNPWEWPFSSDSIWNYPIASRAQYHSTNLPLANVINYDLDLLFKIPANSPERPLYDPGSWVKRCSGTTTYEQLKIPIPDHLLVADAIDEPGRYETPNNAAALLQADGRTIIQLEPMARCEAKGPVYGYRWPKSNVDLYSDGIAGSHLGSGLSALGGAIRKGELLSAKPIRHALKLEIWEKYLYYRADSETPGFRWPADRTDAAAPQIYLGDDAELTMGALMAIPPEVSESDLVLETPIGRQLYQALRDYGGYIVDSTGWDAYAIALEAGVETEVQAAYSYGFGGSGSAPTPLYRDCLKLFQSLAVVTSNGPTALGGGGTPKLPLAPPLPTVPG